MQLQNELQCVLDSRFTVFSMYYDLRNRGSLKYHLYLSKILGQTYTMGNCKLHYAPHDQHVWTLQHSKRYKTLASFLS